MASRSRLPLAVPLAVLLASASVTSAQDRIESAPRPAPRPGVPSTGPRDGPPGGVEGQTTGTARISGRVVRGDTGAPLRGAVVRVVGEGLDEPRSTTTEPDGRYELGELPAGRFFVSATKGSYVSITHGQRRAAEQGRPIELDGRQHVANVNFSLPRGSVITGRITDEFGEPVAHLAVSAMQYRYFGGRRQLFPAERDATDDRGQYRIFGLPPGDYYVSASAEGVTFGMASAGREGVAPTYYPGTPALSEAERVQLRVGEENASVSFAVVAARSVTVSGTVLESSGARARAGFIVVQPDSGGGPVFTMRGGGMVRPDGTFKIGNLSPGGYMLHVNTGDSPRDDGEYAMVPLTVGSEDVSGLTVVTSAPSHVTGQIVFETAPPESIRQEEFVFLLRGEDPTAPMRGTGPISPDESWTFETRAQRSPVFVQTVRMPDGWGLKAVLHGGVDVTDSGIEFRVGNPVEGVQLVISNRFAAVTGSVATSDGRAAADYTVVVLPDDPNRWRPRSRYIATARPSQRGTFEIARLPAGRYLAAAVDYLEQGQHTDAEYLELLRGYATPFELRDGERRTLKLELVTVN